MNAEKAIASNRFGGCFAKDGQEVVWNPDSYKGVVVNRQGARIYDPVGYASKLWARSIRATALKAQEEQSPAFMYVLSLVDRKVYVGMTEDPVQRMEDHLTNQGAKCLENVVIRSVRFYPCASVEDAKAAEKEMYQEIKKEKGTDLVRGAGNTRPFPDATKS